MTCVPEWAMGWAIAQTAPSSSAKMVLIAIASRVDEAGVVRASQAEIAGIAMLTDRSVRAALKLLEVARLITRAKNAGAGKGRQADTLSLPVSKSSFRNGNRKMEPVRQTENGTGEKIKAQQEPISWLQAENASGCLEDSKPRACIGYAGARAETPINITTTLRDNLSNLELVVEGGSGGKDFALIAEPASRAKPKRSATERSMPKKPTIKMIEHAASKGFVNGSVSAMFERWRDYHIAKATPIADHEASWRTWVGNQAEFSKAKPKNRNGVRPNPYLHTRVVR